MENSDTVLSETSSNNLDTKQRAYATGKRKKLYC